MPSAPVSQHASRDASVDNKKVCIIITCRGGDARTDLVREVLSSSLADFSSRLGHSTLGVSWRSSIGSNDSGNLCVVWHYCETVATVVLDWILCSENSSHLILSFSSVYGNASRSTLQKETLELWREVMAEDWRSSSLLRVHCGNQYGCQLWFDHEREIVRIVEWIQNDVLDALRLGRSDTHTALKPYSFKPLRKGSNVTAGRCRYFLFFRADWYPPHRMDPWETTTKIVESFCQQQHMEYSAHYSCCPDYLTALHCVHRGDRTKLDISERFKHFGLVAKWDRIEVEVKPILPKRDQLGNEVMENEIVIVLNVTYLDDYVATDSAKPSSSQFER